MSQIKNDRLLKAIWRQPLDRTPIWIMRQAGRYLPEYRKTRSQAGSFMTLCKTPELACEVTMQPLRRYALDASIIFSDILTIPDAMGMDLQFIEGKGPFFNKPIKTVKQINELCPPDLANLNYVYEAIQLVKKEINQQIPLIGFCGSPWTLAAYMIEGQSNPGFPAIQKLKTENATALHTLLNTLSLAISNHLNAQINAGADAVMIFDTWGGLLDTQNYASLSLFYIKKIIANLNLEQPNKKIPVILFTKKGHQWLELMAETNCQLIGVDWEISLSEARTRLNNQYSLQGNMHPEFLLKTPHEIRAEVARILASYGYGSGHVFNLGHGITPDVPPENVAVLIEAVQELSQAYHNQ